MENESKSLRAALDVKNKPYLFYSENDLLDLLTDSDKKLWPLHWTNDLFLFYEKNPGSGISHPIDDYHIEVEEAFHIFDELWAEHIKIQSKALKYYDGMLLDLLKDKTGWNCWGAIGKTILVIICLLYVAFVFSIVDVDFWGGIALIFIATPTVALGCYLGFRIAVFLGVLIYNVYHDMKAQNLFLAKKHILLDILNQQKKYLSQKNSK